MKITVNPPFIKLDSLLKLCGVLGTGGQAKLVITDGLVKVNGEVCTQRGKKIKEGDTVTAYLDGELTEIEVSFT